MSVTALLHSVTPSSKLMKLRVNLGTLKLQFVVTSKGGLGDLSNLAILLFDLSKAIQSSGEQLTQESDKSGFKIPNSTW